MSERTMQQVRILAHGGLEALTRETVPVPEPGPGEVRVRIAAIALNHLDLWVRRGVAGAKFPLPLIPCSEGAGVIDAVGPGLDPEQHLAQRVVIAPAVGCGGCERCLAGRDNECSGYKIKGESCDGNAREFTVLPLSELLPAPSGPSFEELAAFPLTFITAWQMVERKACIEAGQRVLIHAAASGVSSAAIQMARLRGAEVAATAGSAEKREHALRLGAGVAIDATEADWPNRAREFAPRGFDAVIDHLGAATFEPSLRLLRKGGRYVFCGATTGFEMKTDFRRVFFRNLEILGSTMGRRSDLTTTLQLLAEKRLQVPIAARFEFSELGEAHAMLEQRRAIGKVVVRVSG